MGGYGEVEWGMVCGSVKEEVVRGLKVVVLVRGSGDMERKSEIVCVDRCVCELTVFSLLCPRPVPTYPT